MTHRMLVAGLVATIGLVLTLAPVETFGGSVGVTAGRAPAFHGGFRPGFMRPLPGVPRAGVIGLGGTAHRPSAPHHRRVFGFSGPYAYGIPYVPPGYVAPYTGGEPPPAAAGAPPDGGTRVIIVRPPKCESQTHTVPSEAGGERQVTVRRCWPGLQLSASEIGN